MEGLDNSHLLSQLWLRFLLSPVISKLLPTLPVWDSPVYAGKGIWVFVFEVMVFQKDEISQTLQAQQSLQVLELLFNLWTACLAQEETKQEGFACSNTGFCFGAGYLGFLSSQWKETGVAGMWLIPSKAVSQQPSSHSDIMNNVVQVSSEHDLFIPGVNNPHFLYKLRASLPLVENYIMFIWPVHISLHNNSLTTIVTGFHCLISVPCVNWTEKEICTG